MAKVTTNATQQRLLEIGEQLGFVAKAEHTFTLGKNYYEPRYDVVWFVDISTLNFKKGAIKLLGRSTPKVLKESLIPLAAFEIEGSTTSSKNQVGNIQNLKVCPAHFKFLVVDNLNATTENDTYRRALKIIKSERLATGNQNLFLLDASFLMNADDFAETTIQQSSKNLVITKGSGGETKAERYREFVVQAFKGSYVDLSYDYTPAQHDWSYSVDKKYQDIKSDGEDNILLKQGVIWEPRHKSERKVSNAGTLYYRPKIDICISFTLTDGLQQFFVKAGESLGKDIVHFPLLNYAVEHPTKPYVFPLLGIEIESQSSKHALGGISNLSDYFYRGVIIGPKDLKRYVQTMDKFLGLQNITFLDEEKLHK